MTKRRRSEEGWDEIPLSLEVGRLQTDSMEGAVVEQIELEGVPTITSNEVAKGAEQQLAVEGLADVAVGVAGSLRGAAEVSPNPGPPVVTELDTTTELERAGQGPALANWLRGVEVDVASQQPANPSWFWELLEEAGGDVW